MDINTIPAQIVQNVQNTHPVALTADATAIGVAGASVVGWFPDHIATIAATLSALYLIIQIGIAIESWYRKRKFRQHHHKDK